MIRVVTTMNRAGWKQTGARMIEAFRVQWPVDVDLIVYAEDFDISEQSGVIVRRLPQWLTEFKAKYNDNNMANGRTPNRYDFRFDAVKFSHKVAAFTDAGLAQDEGILIWLDADTFTHSQVTVEWINDLFPEPSYVAWLDRLNHYPETGFVMVRCSHRAHRMAMQAFAELYTSGQMFRLNDQTDCTAFQHTIEGLQRAGEIEAPVSLSGDRAWSHPFVNGPLGACMDHMKGQNRKRQGHSDRWDLRKPRTERYWQKLGRGR